MKLARLALLAVLPLAVMPAAAQVGGERGLFEIRVGRLAPFVTTVTIDTHGAVLIPVAAVLTAAGMPAHGDSADAFLTAPALGRLLGARVNVDLTALVITVHRVTPFPAEREAARLRDGGLTPVPLAFDNARGAPWRPRSGGALIDWRLIAAPATTRWSTYAESRLGLALLGGDLTVIGRSQSDALGGQRTWGTWSYGYVDPTRPYFRELRIGDVLGGAASIRALHGASITNRQPLRRGHFADVAFAPRVPSGWSYEIYQQGRLIDYADVVAGAQPTVVPVRYGATPIELRMYGPAGEMRVESLTFMVPVSQLPRGRIEYELAAGKCSLADCKALAHATVDAGVSDVLTLGGGAEWVDDWDGRRLMPVVRGSYAPFNGWELEADYQPALFERMRVSYSAGAPVSGTIEGGRRQDRWFGGGSAAARMTRTGWWAPSAVLINAWVNGVRGVADAWHGSVEGIFRGSSFGVRYARNIFLPGVTTATATVVQPSTRGWFRHLPVLTAAVGIGARSARFVEAGATVELERAGTISLAGRSAPTASGGSLVTLSYSVFLNAARVAVQARAASGGRPTTLIDVGSAIAFGAREGVLIDPTVASRSAGVSGVVYYDENANGELDAGDRLAPRARVLAGGHAVVANERARFRVWNIIPYDPVDVRVDSVAGIDPAYSQWPLGQELRATPNLFNHVALGLVRVREVSGLAELNGAAAPGGIRLQLESVQSPIHYETLTFADGSYSFGRVFPGSYVLRVAPTALAALGASADTAHVRVRVAGDAPSRSSGPTVVIRARR